VGGFFFLDELTMSGGRPNLRARRPHSLLPVNIEFESSGSLIGPSRIGPRKSRPVHILWVKCKLLIENKIY
jgi:hypothetical protein